MPRALALIESVDHVCGRYRVRAFGPALESAGWTLHVEAIERGPIKRIRQIDRAAEYDSVLLQRKLLPPWQVRRLRARARRLIFDFDDAVVYRDSNDPRGPNDPRRARRFVEVVRSADRLTAGNDFLRSLAIESGALDESVALMPTCVDPSLYPAPMTPALRRLDLVWIGSSSTLRGVEARRDVWERVGREIPGVRLRVICDRFPDFSPLDVVPIAWSEADEAAELAKSDVGISCLPDDLWSRGKCGLKTLQYAAAGLPTVANPVGVQARMVEDGVTGFLVESADDWLAALRTLDQEPDLRAEMGRNARAMVESDYSVGAWSSRFVEALTGVGRAFDSTRPTPERSLQGMTQNPGR